MKTKRLLIVIPTYNEAKNIKPLAEAMQKVIEGLKTFHTDILFIDDLSPDGTATEIKKFQSENPNVHLLSGKKTGLGDAYKRGIEYGLSQKTYDILVTMDADLSHDPVMIPKLVASIDSGSDVVLGSRYIQGGNYERSYSIVRKIQSILAIFVAGRRQAGFKSSKDITSGFRAIRVSKLRLINVNLISAHGYVFQVCLLNALIEKGSIVTEVPITFRKRLNGTSKVRFFDIAEFLTFSIILHANAMRMSLLEYFNRRSYIDAPKRPVSSTTPLSLSEPPSFTISEFNR